MAIRHLEEGHATLALDRRARDLAGLTLTFDRGFTLKAIPGHDVEMQMDYGNPHDVPAPNYLVQMLATDVQDNAVCKGDLFSTVVHGVTYNWSVGNVEIQDITGWIRIPINYLSKGGVDV